ncbi:helix-turn-helix transcriptional regulator [Liberiplasma polymorphum]|jgi:DNA-binding XRE family transcriptional regulator|uniref:helix-turn-helix transcriptional regulator n=1 Tax=Liberiplasma polymorphum TaxID=3374570 RepID=UPI003774F3F8
MTYAQKIKRLREVLLITQQELAYLLGVSIVTVNRWENGKYEPTMKMKRKIVELSKTNNIELEGIK